VVKAYKLLGPKLNWKKSLSLINVSLQFYRGGINSEIDILFNTRHLCIVIASYCGHLSTI